MKTYTRKTITYSENMMKELVKELELGTRLEIDRKLVEVEDINKLTLEDLEIEIVDGEVYIFNKLYRHSDGELTIIYYRLENTKGTSNNDPYVKETRTAEKPSTYEVEYNLNNLIAN